MTKTAVIYMHEKRAGILTQQPDGSYDFQYVSNYTGPAISLTLPTTQEHYHFDQFPAFFDGLLPEGPMLEALLRHAKLDRHDYLGQLIMIGEELVGAVSVRPST